MPVEIEAHITDEVGILRNMCVHSFVKSTLFLNGSGKSGMLKMDEWNTTA